MTHREGTFSTSDGIQLFQQSWTCQNPKAVVVVVHGLAEHSGRYAHVGMALNVRGYDVYAFDGRSHGRSPGEKALIESFDRYVQDLAEFVHKVAAERPTKPLFVLGHSMGGGVVTAFALFHQPDVDGLILSAPAIAAGEDFSPLLMRLAPLLGRLLPKLPTQTLDSRSISRDPEILRQYDHDPLNYRGPILARTGAELLQAVQRIQLRLGDMRLPFLVLHGEADQLTNPQGSQRLYQQASSSDKTHKQYPGLFHEILNEPEKDLVIDDIASWLDARV